ncbi:hypothetical protein ACVWYG_003484, partial [Pedobacter sp. UYEF25]
GKPGVRHERGLEANSLTLAQLGARPTSSIEKTEI